MEAFLSWLLQTMSWYDREESVSWPTGNIDVVAASNLRCHEDLCGVFSVLSGPHAIAEYCALVAAGLEGRPRDKFNPCSARDAHIMLQMKRIFEASAAPQDTGQGGALALPPPCRKKISCIFRCALEVGKAVRNPDCLTQIEALRGFGEGGRYSRQPPRRLAREAADVAWSSIIKPTVARCVRDLDGFSNGKRVTRFRTNVEEAVRVATQLHTWSDDVAYTVLKRTRRLLHAPTLEIKAGNLVNEAAITKDAVAAAKEVLAEYSYSQASPESSTRAMVGSGDGMS